MESAPRIDVFNNVETLKSLLSKNEITGFRPWRSDGYKWISFTDYFVFGSPKEGSNAQNNLAYYISSDFEEFVEEVKLVLNINNQEESKEAIETFVRYALKTFSALNVPPPQNLLTAITRAEEFHYEDDLYWATFTILKKNVSSWSLLIRSK